MSAAGKSATKPSTLKATSAAGAGAVVGGLAGFAIGGPFGAVALSVMGAAVGGKKQADLELSREQVLKVFCTHSNIHIHPLELYFVHTHSHTHTLTHSLTHSPICIWFVCFDNT